jgi:Na+-driven multidrug efflux pump
MVAITAFAQWRPEAMIGVFTREPRVLEVGVLFLRLVSWNFVAQGLIFTCSSMFQGLGNTKPSLLSSFTRMITYAVPAIWLSNQPYFRIEYVWYLSIATVTLQAIVSLWLLRVEFRKRLIPMGVLPATNKAVIG